MAVHRNDGVACGHPFMRCPSLVTNLKDQAEGEFLHKSLLQNYFHSWFDTLRYLKTGLTTKGNLARNAERSPLALRYRRAISTFARGSQDTELMERR